MELIESSLTAACVIALMSACKVVLSSYGVPKFPALFSAFLVPIGIGVFLEVNFPRLYAFMIARRNWFTMIVCSTFSFVSYGLIAMKANLGLQEQLPPNSSIILYVWDRYDVIIVRSFVTGIILGILLRTTVSSPEVLSLQPRSVDAVKRRIIFAISALVILIPLPPIPIFVVSIYLFGIGFGVFLHFIARTAWRNHAHRNQRWLTIRERTRPSGQGLNLTAKEKLAIWYYTNERFWRLKRLLERVRKSTTLVILQVCMLRIQGKYELALNALDAELENNKRTETLDSKLLCLKALSYGELGKKAAMWKSLKAALKENSNCMLTNLTCALRLAEEIPLTVGINQQVTLDQDSYILDKSPKEYLWEALRINLERSSSQDGFSLEEKIVGYSVPITWTFLEDARAYVLMKEGDMRLSRILLTSCIHHDPTFSSAYLHLGEWFMKRLLSNQLSPTQAMEVSKLARISLYVAKYLEGRKKSHLKRRAIACLEELGQIEQKIGERESLNTFPKNLSRYL